MSTLFLIKFSEAYLVIIDTLMNTLFPNKANEAIFVRRKGSDADLVLNLLFVGRLYSYSGA